MFGGRLLQAIEGRLFGGGGGCSDCSQALYNDCYDRPDCNSGRCDNGNCGDYNYSMRDRNEHYYAGRSHGAFGSLSRLGGFGGYGGYGAAGLGSMLGFGLMGGFRGGYGRGMLGGMFGGMLGGLIGRLISRRFSGGGGGCDEGNFDM